MKNSSQESNFPHLEFCCPEKWNGMQRSETGRFCGKCEKVIVDFSRKSNEEIITAINNSTKTDSCGSFRAYQLQRPFGDKRDRIVKFYQRSISISKRKTFLKTIRLALAIVLLFVTGCYRRTMGIYDCTPPTHRQLKKDEREAKHIYDSIHPKSKNIRERF